MISIIVVRQPVCSSTQVEVYYYNLEAFRGPIVDFINAGLRESSSDTDELLRTFETDQDSFDANQLRIILAASAWEGYEIGSVITAIDCAFQTGGPLEIVVDPFWGEKAEVLELVIRRKEDGGDLQLRFTFEVRGDLGCLMGIDGLYPPEGVSPRPICRVTADIDQEALRLALVELGIDSDGAGVLSSGISDAAQTDQAYERIWAKMI